MLNMQPCNQRFTIVGDIQVWGVAMDITFCFSISEISFSKSEQTCEISENEIPKKPDNFSNTTATRNIATIQMWMVVVQLDIGHPGLFGLYLHQLCVFPHSFFSRYII